MAREISQPRIPPIGFKYNARSVQSLRGGLRLLYRVHFDKANTKYVSGRGLVAGKLCSEGHTDFAKSKALSERTIKTCVKPTCKEVENYMDNEQMHSRLIWTTMSLMSAFQWAEEISQHNTDLKDISIVVIDAEKVANHAYTALEVLEEARCPGKYPRFAYTLQVVFVVNEIPASAILSIREWKSVIEQLPPWLIEPGRTPPMFIQLGEEERPKTRCLFNKIRKNYGECCKGPLVERTQLRALDFALYLLDRQDYVVDERAVNLLCELAWYVLTFPVADWSGETEQAAYSYPTTEQRMRFDELVRRDVGFGGVVFEMGAFLEYVEGLSVHGSSGAEEQ